MTTILQITSSVRGSAAVSTLLARELVGRLTARDPNARVITRDVAAEPVPLLDGDALAALSTPADQRTPAQAALVASHDALIAELLAADVVVLGVPLYNFGVPVQLKAYFDAIARAGTTFRYTAEGPEGLVKGKRVYVVLGRGGLYHGTPNDVQTPYLQQFLAFLGMTDVSLVFAEGLNMGPDAQRAGLESARRTMATLVDEAPYALSA